MKNSYQSTPQNAFTLAEILITLAVIGIVAALTIPALVETHNQKAWNTAADVFTKRLEVATRQMNTEEKLSGYATTKDFVNELKKYIKITRICNNDEITKCFAREVIWNQDDDPIDMSKIKKAKNLGQDDWDTDTVAVQFANGVNAIIAYNPNATQDPYNNQFGATANSMAILYDVSGNKNPNTSNKDLRSINVKKLNSKNCIITLNGICFSSAFNPTPLTQDECETLKQELGISYCNYLHLKYAGAVKYCGTTQNIPTGEQLGILADYIYNTSNISTSNKEELQRDNEKVRNLGFLLENNNGTFSVWSNNQNNGNSSFYRTFTPEKTTYTSTTYTSNASSHFSNHQAICVY